MSFVSKTFNYLLSFYSFPMLECTGNASTTEERLRQADTLSSQFTKKFQKKYPVSSTVLTASVATNNAISNFVHKHPNWSGFASIVLLDLAMHCFFPGLRVTKVIAREGLAVLSGVALTEKMKSVFQEQVPVLGATRKEVDKIIDEVVTTSESPVYELVQMSAQPSKINTDLIRYAIRSACTWVAAAPLSKRFLYKVEYDGIEVAHLIGTKHVTNALVAQDQKLHEIVAGSDRLYLENASPVLLYFMNMSAKLRGCLSMEVELAQTAQRNNIPVDGLESLHSQLEAVNQFLQLMKQEHQIDDPRAVERVKYHMHHYESELVDAYRTANSQEVYLLIAKTANPKAYEVIDVQRNHSWVERLIPALKRLKDGERQSASYERDLFLPDLMSTRMSARKKQDLKDSVVYLDTAGKVHFMIKPICIAVGAAHCLGKEGLVLQLRAKGFTVTKEENI